MIVNPPLPPPQDIEIQGWCPAGTFLPHGEKELLLVLVGHPSSDGVTIKMPYRVDVLLYRLASHPIFSYFLHDLLP